MGFCCFYQYHIVSVNFKKFSVLNTVFCIMLKHNTVNYLGNTVTMLNDRILKNAKPTEKAYKLTDRDGMYAYVATSGTISFRFDYHFNGRRETFTIGRYGIISLAEARERLMVAKKQLEQGISPAKEKRERKEATKTGETFGAWFIKYMDNADFADSTRQFRKDVYERNIRRVFDNKKMSEITTQDIRTLCDKIKLRGAPSAALFVRDIFAHVYQFAISKGLAVSNPAREIAPLSIARVKARERALSEREIKTFLKYLEKSDVYPTSKKGLQLILLTLVRKGELINAKWHEIDFDEKIWRIPAERMKARRAHNVYLSNQTIEILKYLKILAENSPYILPARGKPNQAMAMSSLNRAIKKVLALARNDGIAFVDFTVHDLRRTGSTILHEQGYQSDWIEKALAHEQRGVRAVYNKAEYADQRRKMLQDWADWIDNLKG